MRYGLALLFVVIGCIPAGEGGSNAPRDAAPAGTGGSAPAPAGTGGSIPAGSAGSGGSGGTGGGAPRPADAGARDAAVRAPDGRAPDGGAPAAARNPFVYVGSSGANQIRIFELDLASGALMPRGSAPSGPSPNYLAFHPSGKYVYALNEIAAGRVQAFAVDPATGALTALNSQSSGGSGPAHLSVHRSGRWLLVANYGSGEAAVVPIQADGRLLPTLPAVRAGTFAHMIVDDGVTGRFVFVTSKGDNRTLQYRFDEATGQLTPNTPAFVSQGGPARHLAFHRSGSFAYVLTEGEPNGRRVFSYRYDRTTGLLSDGVAHPAAPLDVRADGAHVMVHPTRDLLFASIRFYNSIAVFDIGPDGRLSGPRETRAQIARPWDFAIDPSGQWLLVANSDNASVRVFRIDATGALTPTGPAAAVAPQPRFVGILPVP